MKLDVAQIVTYGAAGAVVLVFLLVLILSLRPRRPKRLSTRQYNAELFKRRMALEELPYAVLHDVRLKDTKGGIIAIDQVIRLPASILLITSAPRMWAGRSWRPPPPGSGNM
ncbi:NERD domain-containing protein [Aerophototrophica crusticola]|uniref:NERD domain-containing protein n=1 Tax=Aerophototrophica crusticola TaxID=1709002 RepID=A0A858R7M4_9PROT|nr:NERD domain-containing protein [Rhodospirillaceae bacterium B3]